MIEDTERPATFDPEAVRSLLKSNPNLKTILKGARKYEASKQIDSVVLRNKDNKKHLINKSTKIALASLGALVASATTGVALNPGNINANILDNSHEESSDLTTDAFKPVIATPEGTVTIIATPTKIVEPAITTSPVTMATEQPKPTSTPEKSITFEHGLFRDFIAPILTKKTTEVRAEYSKDPEYLKSIDPELNQDRVNFVLVGLGSEVEPLTDSLIVLSYSTKENKFLMLNIPRDVHAPEVDRYKKSHNIPSPDFNAVNTAYWTGQEPLLKQVIADSTGLSPDFMFNFTIDGFAELMNETVGKIKINSEENMIIPPRKSDHKEMVIEKGKTYDMNGETLEEFLRERTSTSDLARNKRQQAAIDSVVDQLIITLGSSNPADAYNLLSRLDSGTKRLANEKKIKVDDRVWEPLISGLKNNWFDITRGALESKLKGKSFIDRPQIEKFVFDESHGLKTGTEQKAIGIRDHLRTVEGGDYQAENLMTGYWQKFRENVKNAVNKKTT